MEQNAERKKERRFLLFGHALLLALLLCGWLRGIAPFMGTATPPRMLFLISGLLIPVIGYFYFLLRRLIRTLLPHASFRLREGVTLLLAALIMTPATDIFGTPLLLVLHVDVIGLLVLLTSFAARLCGFRSEVWRRFAASGLIPFVGTALIAGYGAYNIRHAVPVTYDIVTEKALPAGGYTAIYLSDLHYGNATERAGLEAYARAMQAEKPDFVFLGGDIVDERTTAEGLRDAFEVLGGIRPTYGTYYVYGNHDKGLYSSACAFTPEELRETIERNGIEILEDRSVFVTPDFAVTGRMDRSDPMRTGIPRAASAVLAEGLPPEAFHLMLDHQPRQFAENAEAGYDLMLSGHTHRGQIWPLGLIVAALDKGTMLYGRDMRDGIEAIVSSGLVGWGYPLRTEGESEYLILHIHN